MADVQCSFCYEPFQPLPEDLDFYQRVSPTFNGATFLMPPPDRCPSCRQRQILSWRNERNLYRRKCDFSGNSIISMHRPDAPYPVYDRTAWWGDKWDPKSYGKEYDFSRTFFSQLGDLIRAVPWFGLYHMNELDNSDYSNYAWNAKNCYLCFSVTHSEDCSYANMVDHCRDCVDCLNIDRCELAYECVDCTRCYSSSYLERCVGCSDSLFCLDCINCQNCVGCCNLQNGSFYWFNENIGEKEFRRRRAALITDSRMALSRLQAEAYSFWLSQPKRCAQIVNAENCSGDNVINSENCQLCFDIRDCRDSNYNCRGYNMQDCQDTYGVPGTELVYQAMSANGTKVAFAVSSYFISDAYYIINCFNSSWLFGCVALNHANYCILNKEYSEDDFHRLANKICQQMEQNGEWGEFFPQQLSPYGFNETIGADFYPLTEAQATAAGFNWCHYTSPPPRVSTSLTSDQVPDLSNNVADSILESAIVCQSSGKPFRLTPQELKFYRLNLLPIPTVHPDERHKARLARKNPRKLWARYCEQCGEKILSTYSLERPEIVFCQDCYQSLASNV